MRKGYVLIDIIISFACFMILLVPLFKTLNLIENSNNQSLEHDKTIDIMNYAKSQIQESSSISSVKSYYKKDDYDIKVESANSFKRKVYKYEVCIKKDGELVSDFFIYKVFE